MSLQSATCPIHGVVKVHPNTLRHSCGHLCEVIASEPVNDLPRVNLAVSLHHEEGAAPPKPRAEPEPAAPETPVVAPVSNPDWHLTRVGRIGLPQGRVAKAWAESTRALIAAAEQEITDRRACMQTDAARMAELGDLVQVQKRLLERAGITLEPEVEPAAAAAAHSVVGTGKPWCRKYPELRGCVACGRSDRRHASKGRCGACAAAGRAPWPRGVAS